MIRIIAVGRLSTEYKSLEEEYMKRMRNSVEILELKESEEKNILDKVKGALVALDLKGKQYSSEEFAQFLKQNDKLCFVIGGHQGLPENVLQQAQYTISFSRMTFPHQLFRIILLEQIYRGYSILQNKPYHK